MIHQLNANELEYKLVKLLSFVCILQTTTKFIETQNFANEFKTVPDDDLHPNVIPFIPTQIHQLQTSTHGVSFQSNTNISTFHTRIYFNTSSSSPLSLSSPMQMPLLPITASTTTRNHPVKGGFLVWSPSCQIPALDPLAKDVMKLFRRGNFECFISIISYAFTF